MADRPRDLPASQITPERLYWGRREFLKNALLFTATSGGLASSLLWLTNGSRSAGRSSTPASHAVLPAVAASPYSSDQELDLAALVADVVKRRFLFLGFASFALLLPLAATSTNAAVRRLGYPHWKRLHRLAYLAGALAIMHFIWRVKSDLSEPLAYGAVLTLLVGTRAATAMAERFGRAPSRGRVV